MRGRKGTLRKGAPHSRVIFSQASTEADYDRYFQTQQPADTVQFSHTFTTCCAEFIYLDQRELIVAYSGGAVTIRNNRHRSTTKTIHIVSWDRHRRRFSRLFLHTK